MIRQYSFNYHVGKGKGMTTEKAMNILNGPFVRNSGVLNFEGFVAPTQDSKHLYISNGSSNYLLVEYVESPSDASNKKNFLNVTARVGVDSVTKKNGERIARAESEDLVDRLSDLTGLEILRRHRKR